MTLKFPVSSSFATRINLRTRTQNAISRYILAKEIKRAVAKSFVKDARVHGDLKKKKTYHRYTRYRTWVVLIPHCCH